MKKAKIFLTALTVLTVVGGALAFKSAKGLSSFYSCDIPSQKCTVFVTVIPATTTEPGQGVLTDMDLVDAYCKPGNICQTYTTMYN